MLFENREILGQIELWISSVKLFDNIGYQETLSITIGAFGFRCSRTATLEILWVVRTVISIGVRKRSVVDVDVNRWQIVRTRTASAFVQIIKAKTVGRVDTIWVGIVVML